MLMLARKFANYSRLAERSRALQHAPKIILGVLLSCTLDIKIARLFLIFNLVLVLHVPSVRPLTSEEACTEPCETSKMELFCENS